MKNYLISYSTVGVGAPDNRSSLIEVVLSQFGPIWATDYHAGLIMISSDDSADEIAKNIMDNFDAAESDSVYVFEVGTSFEGGQGDSKFMQSVRQKLAP